MFKKIFLLFTLIFLAGSVLAWTPPANIDLQDYYNFTGAYIINGTLYYGNASQMTGVIATSNYSSFSNSSTFWLDYAAASDLNNLITLDWTNLTDYPVACPTGSAVTQLNDSITCTDYWVYRGGDTMTGNLGINMTPVYELDVNGTIRAYNNIIVGNNTGAAGFTGLGDLYALGNVKVMEGVFVEAQGYGAGLEISDNDLAIISTNIFTANATLNATTQILYDSEASFNSTYENQFLRVITSAGVSFPGATGQITDVLNSTHIILSFGSAGNDPIPDATGMSYIIYPTPTLAVLDNGDVLVSIGDGFDASFKVIIMNGTNDHGVHIDSVAGTEDYASMQIDTDKNNKTGIIGLLVYLESEVETELDSTNLYLENNLNLVNNSKQSFITMRTIGNVKGNEVDGIDMSTNIKHLIHVGSGDSITKVYDVGTDITTEATTSGSTAEVFTADNDALYVGAGVNFTSVSFDLETPSSTDAAFTYHYCNTAGNWVNLPGVTDTTAGFTTSGGITFTNPTDRGVCNEQIGGTPFGNTTDYAYIALQRTRNNIVNPPVLDVITIAGATSNFLLAKDYMKLNAVDTAPETCDATMLGAIYFDISEDGMCQCAAGGWELIKDDSACT